MTINLVTLWFVISGIFSLIIAFFVDDFMIQFAVFVLLGALFMVLTKPTLDKMVKQKKEKLNLERIIGMKGIVTEKINPDEIGEVKADGKLWSAISEVSIEFGCEVEIIGIEGVKLVVKKVKAKVKAKSKEEKKETATKKKKNPTKKKEV